MSVIALDLGGTKLSAAIFSDTGTPSHKRYSRLENKTGRAVGVLITDTVKSLLQDAEQEAIPVSAVGICIPGISYAKSKTVWVPNIPGWENYPLHQEIENALANPSLSIVVDNDRACSVLGECWKGVAKGCDNVIFMAVGTGIGAGILADGKVLRGADDIAGAIGWMALQPPYEKKYDACGNFEFYASGEGLVRAAKEFADKNDAESLTKEQLQTEAIFTRYEKKDAVAQKVIRQAITYWGMATANLVSIFNPRKIVFGGGVFGPALQFLPEIKAEAEKWAQPISVKKVSFEGSSLGGDAGLYGAAFQAHAARSDFS